MIDAVGDGRRGPCSRGDRVAALVVHAATPNTMSPTRRGRRLPAALDGQPFPGEPLGCAMNIFRRSEIRAGQTVAIVGIGFLGAILTRLASRRRRAGDRDLAPALLARSRAAVRRGRDDPDGRSLGDHRAGQGLTGGAFCDRVIEAVGKQWPLDLAAELVGERRPAGHRRLPSGRAAAGQHAGCGTGRAST